MGTETAQPLAEFDDNDVLGIAKLARKATRKAANEAEKAGFLVERDENTCVVKTPGNVLRFAVHNTAIDVNKRYSFLRHE
jgi:hypothetical protein